MAHVPGPDFPGGGILVDDGTLREAYETGRGTIRIRARAEIEPISSRRQGIVVTELPYMVGPEPRTGQDPGVGNQRQARWCGHGQRPLRP